MIRFSNEISGSYIVGFGASGRYRHNPWKTIGFFSAVTVWWREKKGRLLSMLSFGSYNKRIPDAEHEFAWLQYR